METAGDSASGSFELASLDLSDKKVLDEIATVATRAFQYDPFFVHLCPPPLLRARGLAIFWRSQVAGYAPWAEGYGARLADGRLGGAAIWVKPEGFPLPVGPQLRQSAGALRALFTRPKALVDGTKYLLAIEKVHPKEPLWYLDLLVADPAVQRRGIGTALQQPVLEKADADGLASYLETQNEENLLYYRRFGFEVGKELHPVADGPPLWTMRRQPRAAS